MQTAEYITPQNNYTYFEISENMSIVFSVSYVNRISSAIKINISYPVCRLLTSVLS